MGRLGKRLPEIDRRLWIGGGVALVLAASALTVVLSSASVTLLVTAQKVQSDLQLQGSAHAFHDTSLTTFDTRALSVNESGTTAGQATGRKQIAAVPATGEVLFSEAPCTQSGAILAGTVVATSTGQQFQTGDVLTIGPGACTVDGKITAMAAGAAGNVPAGSITQVVQIQHAPPGILVDNLAATAGGADARSETFVQQSDVDAARQSLLSQLDAQARAALKDQAGSLLSHLIVSSSPQLTSQLDQPVGAQAPSFTLTLNETLTAAAFSDSDVHQRLRLAVESRVPQGYALTGDPIKTWFDVTAASEDGSMTLSGHGLAYALPVVDRNAVARGIALHGRGAAAARLRALPGVVEVRIDESPLPLPFLPPLSSRISIKILEKSPS